MKVFISALFVALLMGTVAVAAPVKKLSPEAQKQLNQDLLKAAESGLKDRVQQLLFQGADPNAREEGEESRGRTALQLAALSGSQPVVAALIAAKADVNAADNSHSTPLMAAASMDKLEALNELLEAGADVNTKEDNQGFTALLYAANNGYADVVKALIAKGADLSAAEQRRKATALMLASYRGHADVVSALIEGKADVNARDMEGVTALMMASVGSQPAIITLLIQAGADVNAKSQEGNTALDLAKTSEVRNLLKKAGATP